MTTPPFDPIDGTTDPLGEALEALTDLAALLRGGGRVDTSPNELALGFARSMGRVIAERPLEIEIRPAGFYAEGEPLWTKDLMARRVGASLHAQNVSSIVLSPGASPRSLQDLATAICRDWSQEDPVAFAQLVRRSDLSGVDVQFRAVAARSQATGVTPSALIAELQSRRRGDDSTITTVLTNLRAALAMPSDLGLAVRGPSPNDRARLDAEIQTLIEGRDAPSEMMGRVAFESIRLEPSHLQAIDTFRLVFTWFEQLVMQSRATEAFDLIHRPLSLVDEAVVPGWKHREVFRSEVAATLAEPTLGRLVGAIGTSDPALDWRPLLFTLGSITSPERTSSTCTAISRLPLLAQRQAFADGLALAMGRDPKRLEAELQSQTEEGVSIVLLAIGRVEAPALLERILARMDSPSPIIRSSALVALRRYRSPRTQERVRKALHDTDSAVRIEALRYLTVYRDLESAPMIIERLQSKAATDLAEDELRALCKAFSLIARQEAVLPLARVAQDNAIRRPQVATAAMIGLHSLGESGRAALSGLSRSTPELRRLMREAGVAHE